MSPEVAKTRFKITVFFHFIKHVSYNICEIQIIEYKYTTLFVNYNKIKKNNKKIFSSKESLLT